ncbi:MAG: hypothetical protein FK734_04415 [Asgard group archaeon]|nr:hypothetical protein [Asgard group archaeon]
MRKSYTFFAVMGIIILGATITSEILIVHELSKKSGLIFYDEDIIIYVNSTIAYVEARYGLRNYDELTNYWINLPFALQPWDINITANNQSLDYSWKQIEIHPDYGIFPAIQFNIYVEKSEKIDVLVSYYRNFDIVTVNSSEKGLFRYIVGSTWSWNNPLVYSHFELWQGIGEPQTLLETRTYNNWMPTDFFLYFYFDL